MSTLITDSNELTHFTAVISKHDLAADLAPRLSCTEIEALAGLFRALGEPATADTCSRSTPPMTRSVTRTTLATRSSTWSRSTRWTTWASNHSRADATQGAGSVYAERTYAEPQAAPCFPEFVRLPGQSIVVRSHTLRAGLSRHILTRCRSLRYSTTRHCAPLPLTSDPLARQANNNS